MLIQIMQQAHQIQFNVVETIHYSPYVYEEVKHPAAIYKILIAYFTFTFEMLIYYSTALLINTKTILRFGTITTITVGGWPQNRVTHFMHSVRLSVRKFSAFQSVNAEHQKSGASHWVSGVNAE